jgi:DNA-binding sugar fermentation-stimulating protein
LKTRDISHILHVQSVTLYRKYSAAFHLVEEKRRVVCVATGWKGSGSREYLKRENVKEQPGQNDPGLEGFLADPTGWGKALYL